MNKYLNKRYEDDLTEIERMSMHQPAVFDSTYVSKKVRMSNKKPKQIKTTREEARFFGEEPSKPMRKRMKRAQQEHDLQRDMARPVQRKDPKYKSAAEVGIDKAKQKRAQPGKSWINEVCSPPTKKIKMIVAENELPTQSSSKTTKIREDSSKKPPLKSKKVTNKSSDKVTKPSTQLNKSRPRSKSRNDARPSKSDKKSPSSPGDKNAEKLKEHVTESQKSNSDSKKKRSKIEEYRKLLAELKPNAEPEHVRKTAPVTVEPPSVSSAPITELPGQQNSVLDDLGFSSSQESEVESVTGLPKDLSRERQACELCKMVLDKSKYCSSCSSGSETEMEPEHEPEHELEHEPEQEPEQEPEAIVRMEIQDEQPSEIIEIDDDEDVAIPPCPALVDNDGEDDAAADDEDDDDVIFVSSSGPIENLPMYHDRSTGQTFCYGQNLDDF